MRSASSLYRRSCRYTIFRKRTPRRKLSQPWSGYVYSPFSFVSPTAMLRRAGRTCSRREKKGASNDRLPLGDIFRHLFSPRKSCGENRPMERYRSLRVDLNSPSKLRCATFESQGRCSTGVERLRAGQDCARNPIWKDSPSAADSRWITSANTFLFRATVSPRSRPPRSRRSESAGRSPANRRRSEVVRIARDPTLISFLSSRDSAQMLAARLPGSQLRASSYSSGSKAGVDATD